MSLINKKTLLSLYFFNWINSFNKTIDMDALANTPYALEPPLAPGIRGTWSLHTYWFPLETLRFSIAWTIPMRLTKWEKDLNEPITTLKSKDIVYYLSAFTDSSTKIWRDLLPVACDLHNLFKKHNKPWTEKEFLLLDFWFDSLLVINELIFWIDGLNLHLDLTLDIIIDPTRVSKAFAFDTHDIYIRNITEETLRSLNCANWSKKDFINYIYAQFTQIHINLLHEWLLYKKIENIYETKDLFIYEYLTNSLNGLNSLSLNTLKLLALNPPLDLEYARELFLERDRYHKNISTLTPYSTKQQQLEYLRTSLGSALSLGNSKDTD